MRLSIVRDGNALLGLYWLGAGVNRLVLNLTPRFSLQLKFKATKAQDERLRKSMIDTFVEKRRLESLTDKELVAEVFKSDAAEFEPVIELCDRLCPGWLNEEEE